MSFADPQSTSSDASLKDLGVRLGEHLASNPVGAVQQRGLSPARERALVRRLLEQGVTLPAHFLALHGLEAAGATRVRQGVVACVVDARGVGWVDRLRAAPAREWASRTGLPFDALELDEVLLAWLEAGAAVDDVLAGALPEALAFELEDELTTRIEGASMTVAAALAVVDATSGRCAPELAAALSLVQRAGPHGLEPVAGAAAKLAAFERECGRGSVCVVAAGWLDAQARRAAEERFDEVWEVRDLAALGRRLAERGLLAELAHVAPLDSAALDNVLGLMRRLQQGDWLVGRALRLAQRLRAVAARVGYADDVGAPRQREVERARFGPLRYCAALASVERDAAEHVARLAVCADATHEERAVAALDLAQAQALGYRFDAMLRGMRAVAERVEVDPQAFTARTRVRVWSLLGQALVKRAGHAAESLAAFERALVVAAPLGSAEARLARGFRAGALLAMGRLEAAEVALDELAGQGAGRGLAPEFWAFDRAELARRRGEVWGDAALDAVEELRPGRFWRPLGCYLQATARQLGRPAAERARRFARAAEAFGVGVENVDSGHRFLVALMQLGAAAAGADAEAWRAARADLGAFLAEPFAAGHGAWFGARLEALPSELAGGATGEPSCDQAAVALEAVLAHDPYLLGRSNEREWGA